MKTSNVIAILLVLVGFAAAKEVVVWDSTYGGACNTGGSWWSFGDHDSTSFSNFPVTSELDTVDLIGAWVQKNGGIMDVNDTLKYSKNGYEYYGIGFNFKNPEKDVVQKWDSICLEYSLTGNITRFDFQLKSYWDMTHDNDYSLALSKQSGITKTCFSKFDFAQPNPDDINGNADHPHSTVYSIDTVLKTLHGIKFVANASISTKTQTKIGNFKLKSITTKDTFPDVGVLNPGMRRGMRLVQWGRVLSLGGIGNDVATIQLVSLSGNLVSSKRLGSGQVFHVGDLPKGVYLAQVRSGNASYSQRILLP